MRHLRFTAVVLLSFALIPSLPGQTRVDLRRSYERIYCVVPMIGLGTAGDPRRPLLAPLAKDMDPKSHSGILAYQFVESDDGKFALVEFVAANRPALAGILASNSVLKSFLKGRDKDEDVIAEFVKYKKSFTFRMLGVNVR